MTSKAVYLTAIVMDVLPSMVCDDVVLIVTVPVPTFFKVYLFVLPTAVGRVKVVVPLIR